jgi:CheY-like chemotaxis protein
LTESRFCFAGNAPKILSMSTQARILVADDDPAMRAGIKLCLESAGYRVLEAEDEGVGLQRTLEEKPALVVLDVMMPRLDGVTAAAEMIQKAHGEGYILRCTAA